MRNILIIARRDLRAQFNSPGRLRGARRHDAAARASSFFLVAAHRVGGVSVGGFWEVDRATMDQMFEYLPLAPQPLRHPARDDARLAAEKGSGTLELLITMPVRTAR